MTTAVVTGATSRIGYHYARHLASQGHDLVVAARGEERLHSVADELSRAHSVSVTQVVADLSTAKGVLSVLDVATGATIVVANAGSSLASRVGQTAWPDLDRLSYLLGPGVAQLCEGLVPSMLEARTGRITIIASIGGLIPMPKSAIYSAAKAYAIGYGRSAHAELTGRGIRVCTICPGYVRTELHRASGLEHLPDRVPRWMCIEPEDVVRAAERGLDRSTSVVVPGLVYKAARPFLQSTFAGSAWRRMTRRLRSAPVNLKADPTRTCSTRMPSMTVTSRSSTERSGSRAP